MISEPGSQQKSNKRKTKLKLVIKVMASVFQLLEYFSPSIAGWWATRLWLGTHRSPEPAREKTWLESAQLSNLPHKFGPIQLYHWPSEQIDAPRVLLIHGWNGRGLQLASFVKPLLARGYQVISFDAPGHGRSAGTESNLLRMADVVNTISESIGSIDTIISHSFGAMVMVNTIHEGLKIRKAVAISSPIDADYLFEEFCSALKIKNKTKNNLLQRIYKRLGKDIFTRTSAIENAKNLTIPALIVHDKHDHDIPIEHARQLNKAWSGSSLLLTENLGHRRILRNDKVINNIVNFIS